MSRHLFLEGDRGCGKSTCLLQELAPVLECAGGYGTVRLFTEDGMLRAFRQIPANQMLFVNQTYREGLSGVFLDKIANKRVCRNEVLLEETLPLLDPDPSIKFYLLDEIGGVELLLPEWRERLLALLDGPIPCIGVWKSRSNSQALQAQDITDPFVQQYEWMRAEMEKRDSVRFLTVYRKTLPQVREEIHLWAEENGISKGMRKLECI